MPEDLTTDIQSRTEQYWNDLAHDYQEATRISVHDIHYGPLLPGEKDLQLIDRPVEGLRCLELGCGAGQNSIFLSTSGAECIALDLSKEQITHGEKLNELYQAKVDFRHLPMEALEPSMGTFDLIHSAYGLPFAADPAAVIQQCADRLNPGGSLLFSMGHPVYAGEWLELDENDRGIFLTDYFHPSPDVRAGDNHEESTTWARAYPVSTVLDWVLDAGLQLERVLEPAAQPVHTFSEEQILDRVPYYSKDWAAQVQELLKFPIVLIVKATKPKG